MPRTPTSALCQITPADIDRASRLLEMDPVKNVYLRSELRLGIGPGSWWGVASDREIRAVALVGPLVVAWIPDAADAQLLARPILDSGQIRMIVGDMPSALAIYQALPLPAREVRQPQWLMTLDRQALRMPSETLPMRLSSNAELDQVSVAAAAMHIEEMRMDPLNIDADGWRARMAQLMDRGWSWVYEQDGEIVFKAELSAWTEEAAQIQGVYTAPRHRRRGIAGAALAQLCSDLLERTQRVCLFVNNYNHAAVALYQSLGFSHYSDFATVIY